MPENKNTKDIAGFEPTAEPNRPQGKNYLLAIGIDSYDECPTLYNAVKDAKEVVSVLLDKYQFEEEQITTLYDQAATRRNILNQLRELTLKVTPQDNVLIYFSGHGEYDKATDEGYWIPVEAKNGEHADYISNSNIRKHLSAIKSHHTFLMADSCFSGSLFAKGTGRNVSKRYENDPSRWGLTSGRNEIVSDGKPGDNSPFAESLLYRLKKNTGSLNVRDLCNHVTEYVLANANQSPIGEPLQIEGHKYGQFVFHLKKDEVADWKEAISGDTLQAFQLFLVKHPSGKYADEVKSKIKSLKAESLWQQIQATEDDKVATLDTKLGLVNQFVAQYENQIHYGEALDLGELLEYKRTFLLAKGSEFALRKFLRKHTPTVIGGIDIRKEGQHLLDNWGKSKQEEKDIENARREQEEEKKQQAAIIQQQKSEEERQQKVNAQKAEAARKEKEQIEKATPAPKKEKPPLRPRERKKFEIKPKPEASFFKKYGKIILPLLLLSGIVWGVVKWASRPVETSLDLTSQIESEKPAIQLDATTEDSTPPLPKREEIPPNIPPLSLSYNWGEDEIRAIISGGTAPYELILGKNGKEKYKQKATSEGQQKIEITKAYREDAGSYKLIVKDAKKEQAERNLRIDPPQKPVIIKTLPPPDTRAGETGTMQDNAGQSYTWKRMKDGKKWMTQNLNFDVGKGSLHYNKEPKNGAQYGRLYTWEAARKACPSGWRLPSDQEWRNMAKYYGGAENDASDGGKAAYKALMEGGSSGFSARLGGPPLFRSFFRLPR